jgi:hypothetical protein
VSSLFNGLSFKLAIYLIRLAAPILVSIPYGGVLATLWQLDLITAPPALAAHPPRLHHRATFFISFGSQ